MDEENFENFKDREDLSNLANREVAATLHIDIVYNFFYIFDELFLDELLGLDGRFCLFSLHLLIHVGGKHLSSVPPLALLMLLVQPGSNLLAFGLADSVASLESNCCQLILSLDTLLIHCMRVESLVDAAEVLSRVVLRELHVCLALVIQLIQIVYVDDLGLLLQDLHLGLPFNGSFIEE